MRATRPVGFLLAVVAALVVVDARTPLAREPARAFLCDWLLLSEDDVERVDRGQIVTESLDADDPREVATLGAVRLQITPEFYIERLKDIASLKKSDEILQIGTFGHPPDLHDVSELTLEDSDVRSLRRCRVGDCGVQLPADAIRRFSDTVDWRGRDAREQADALMRTILVEYVATYQKRGAAASMEYADRDEPVNLEREFLSLLAAEARPWQPFADLRRHLVEFPAARTTATTDLVYWSKEKVGRRAVASVTHLAISRVGGNRPVDYAIASKQIYGTHYYDASLGLTLLLRDRRAPATATYLVYLNRSRVDVFRGFFGGFARRVVKSRARATVSEQLGRLQRDLDRDFAARLTY
jgi:hypothetical protein